MGESGRYWEEREELSSRCSSLPFRAFRYLRRDEAKARSVAFKTFIPRRSRSEPKQRSGPGPSPSGDQRWAQKASVAARAPPLPVGRARGRRGSKRGRQDLREVIQTRRSQRSHLDQSKT